MKGFSPALRTLFSIILIVNLTGLIPYIFSLSKSTLMLSTTIIPPSPPLDFILESISLLYGLRPHIPFPSQRPYLPRGPQMINPFLVLMRLSGNLVRPITLSFRLAANITAGHIVLTLIGVYGRAAIFNSAFSFIFLLSLQSFYILFELAICLIQAFIFCLLLSLYSEDHPHIKELI